VNVPASLRCLRSPPLRIYLSCVAFSSVGTWLQIFAQQWLMWRLTKSAAGVGMLLVVQAVPTVLFALAGGTLGDRFSRVRVAMFTQTLAAVHALGLAALTAAHLVSPILLLVFAALRGVITGIDQPARQTLLRDLAGEDAPNAIALNSFLFNGSRLFGPALGGLLVAHVGEEVCFALNGLSYVAIVLGLATMVGSSVDGAIKERKAKKFREAIRDAWADDLVRGLLIAAVVMNLLALNHQALMPAIASRLLHGGPELLGWMAAAGGLGASVAGVILLAPHRPHLTLAIGGTVVAALGLWMLSTPIVPVGAVVAVFCTSLGATLHSASAQTLIQMRVPAATQGRVLGVFLMVWWASPLSTLLAGVLADRFGTQRPLLAAGAAALAATVVLARARPAAEPRT
jgi:MFS family permease